MNWRVEVPENPPFLSCEVFNLHGFPIAYVTADGEVEIMFLDYMWIMN